MLTFERLAGLPTLLSAICAISARFFRLDLYSRLLDHTETLIARQVMCGNLDLASIQAIMVLVLWKTPEDRSAYIKVGLAVRAAQQLGIDRERSDGMNQVRVGREDADRDRTWQSEPKPYLESVGLTKLMVYQTFAT